MVLLDVKNLNYALPRGRSLFEDLNFDVEQSSGLLINGVTGSGKTTLTKLLLGITPGYSGEIRIFDNNVSRLNQAKKAVIRSRIGFMMQEPLVFENLSVVKNICYYLELHGCKFKKQDVLDKLYANSFSGLSSKKINRLSWGQIRMIEMIRVLLLSPRLVICDQPFAGLDIENMRWMAEQIKSLVNSGTGVIVTYSLPEVRNLLEEWKLIKLNK